jgi:MarR family transcriptional regulator for hemolysin
MNAPELLLEELTILSRRMRTVFDARVRRVGLTLARARILLRLKKSGSGETQKALAEELEIEAPTLVRLLDGLQEAGTVARVAVDGDRRAKGIVLTTDGRRQAGEVEKTLSAFRTDMLSGIAAEDLDVTLRVIRQMQTNLEQM